MMVFLPALTRTDSGNLASLSIQNSFNRHRLSLTAPLAGNALQGLPFRAICLNSRGNARFFDNSESDKSNSSDYRLSVAKHIR